MQQIGTLVQLFLVRFAIALALVLVTYNIFGMSFYHWVAGAPFEGVFEVMGVLKIIAGLILLIGYGIFLRATWRGKGPVGIIVTVVFCVALVWLLQVAGIINLEKPTTLVLAFQAVLAFIMALGSIWSIVWKSITGQYSVEDPDTTEALQDHR